MRSRLLFAAVSVGLILLAVSAAAETWPTRTRDGLVLTGGAAGETAGKAVGDTILLMGPRNSGAPYLGDFEDGWNGWTSVDQTQTTTTHWQVSGYNQSVAGNLAAWCGSLEFTACVDSLDPVGGYGNNWRDVLTLTVAVADVGVYATVRVQGVLQNDTEPGYDYTRLSRKVSGVFGYNNVQTWDGQGVYAVDETFTYLPGEYVGEGNIEVSFRFDSDGGWSDADCLFYSAGACQLDDLVVTVSQSGHPDLVSTTDFQDGTFGDWAVAYPQGVGDFAKLWTGLEDYDPCQTNYSHQVAFIDDGVVVPGTGGSECINWCYGPNGYIVNTTGGLAGPEAHLQNDVLSPPMAWPDDNMTGAIFAFDVYRHEDLSADSPGIFYNWGVRSADTDNSAGHGFQVLEDQFWGDRDFVYYGGPGYLRPTNVITDLLRPGRDVVQVRLQVYELGWVWGWTGNDGYPAPYFDNVSFKVFEIRGPTMSAREIDLAQDNFPEVDAINTGDLGSLHVRFDMARNIAPSSHLRNDPGDSIVVDIQPGRDGANLSGAPLLHYLIDPNPLFDPYRTAPTSGAVPGTPAVLPPQAPLTWRWAFDLPDSGMLWPGDVLHYYIEASDDVGGVVQSATLPADLTGFSDFSRPLAYNQSFTVRALPSLAPDYWGGYEQPRLLFWNDFANRGAEDEWYTALSNLGFDHNWDYDIYYTNGPSSGVGNGLGGRTSGLALDGYDVMVYSAGDLGTNTLSHGDFEDDPGDDISALNTWLGSGGRGLFLTGDNVASDLVRNAGAAGQGFAESVMGVSLVTNDIHHYIGGQTAPLIKLIPGNPVLYSVSEWIAYGGCPGINTFDAVTPINGAVRLAEFCDNSGNRGAYTYSAATRNLPAPGNIVVSLPYDLMSIYTLPGAKSVAPLAARTKLLDNVLAHMGLENWFYDPAPVPEALRLSVSAAPNPFNPATRLAYTLPAPGHVTLKIFNVRGQLVRTLIDGPVAGSGFVMWDGTDDRGGAVASGVYFSEVRAGGDVKVAKLALVK